MWMSRDAALLIGAGAVRNLGFGFYNVVFAIYLSKLGYSGITIGAVITISSISGVLQTFIAGILMDRYSRKRIMIFLGILTFFSSAVFALTSDPLLVVTVAALGLIGARAGGSGAGGMGGPVMIGQITMLADQVPDKRRTVLFAVNTLVLTLSGSVGALFAALPDILQRSYAFEELPSFRVLFVIGSVMSLLYIVVLLFYREPKPVSYREQSVTESGVSEERTSLWGAIFPEKSKKFVKKMALLGAYDSFGSSLHSSLLSYWFFNVHGASLSQIGPVFAISNFAGCLTLLIGVKLAEKIGNVNATVITHLPAPLLLMLMPFAPDFWWAAVIQVMRQSISRMDNPIKQSYMMGIVPREERARARGITTVFQRSSGSFSPSVAFYLMSAVSTSLPFLLGGAIQFSHDIMYYFTFRKIKPPEEIEREGLDFGAADDDS